MYFIGRLAGARNQDCGARGDCCPLSVADHFEPGRRDGRAAEIRAAVSARIRLAAEIDWYVADKVRLDYVVRAWEAAMGLDVAGLSGQALVNADALRAAAPAAIGGVIGVVEYGHLSRIITAYRAVADALAGENAALAQRNPAAAADLGTLARFIPQVEDRRRLVSYYGTYVARAGVYADNPFLISLSRLGINGVQTVLLFAYDYAANGDIRGTHTRGGWTNGGQFDPAAPNPICLVHHENHYQRMILAAGPALAAVAAPRPAASSGNSLLGSGKPSAPIAPPRT
jgi:hypothetical protein